MNIGAGYGIEIPGEIDNSWWNRYFMAMRKLFNREREH